MKNYKVYVDNNEQIIVLTYTISNYNPDDWIKALRSNEEEFCLLNTFHLSKENIISVDEDDRSYNFKISNVKDSEGYYQIPRDILDTKHDVYINDKLDNLISLNIFISTVTHIPKLSIFNKIDNLIDEPIVVGGNRKNSIPISEFLNLVNGLPTDTELRHYLNSRIENIIGEYFEKIKDSKLLLDKYVSKKLEKEQVKDFDDLKEIELKKFEYVRDTVKDLLSHGEAKPENVWQNIILKVIKVLYPKYVKIIKEMIVKDYYTGDNPKTRTIDISMLDADGNLDIIEIKKAFDSKILNNSTYRDNYIPKRELVGTIMQVEKYIFHLNKWGVSGEKYLREKYKVPNLNITNPKGLIIMGRDSDFDQQQKFDFEIIKRKYSNIMDIITYDDLLRRIDNIIESLS
ncbi:Shedu immune nuclease family protein [Francisella tularensis]|uniref:Shedu immune nuclease family protein n=1 Tax=Francisella tularensis TaxID=263 RepID=UPI001C0F2A23|nr:Shedu immune nuclease family protein [Francisella tularensis]MBK2109028.1 DUF4263 domain-containing protein [Francisella tularensis subsp. novicida FSC595]